MSDKYKIREEDKAYFLTMTVVNWIDAFTRKNHKMAIVDSLKYCQENKGLNIYGWCLMSSHLHLIASAGGQPTMSESHAILIYSPEFFYQKLDYIHKNPVEEMIVEYPEDYLFSSARNYAGRTALLDIIIETPRLITY
jgi:putative transposase